MGGVRSRLGGILALGLLVSGCTGGEDREESTTPASSATSEATDTAADGDCDVELEVVEQGFTVVPGEETGPRISVGLVVENPGDLLATRTDLEVIARDSSGEPVPQKGSGGARMEATVDAVPPGERQGHSFVTYLESSEVASIDVTVRRNSWAVMDEEGEQVETKGARLTGERVEFTAEAPREGPVEGAHTYALFRSSSGDLIGGTSRADGPDTYAAGTPTDKTVNVGTSLTPLPEDAEHVEVYVDHVDPRAEPADCPSA